MREIITILEQKSKPQDIEIIKRNFTDSEVSPVMSKETIELHYDKLAHAYAKRYNTGEGDPDFNFAGTFLSLIILKSQLDFKETSSLRTMVEIPDRS